MTDMLQIIDLQRLGLPMPRTIHELSDLVQASYSAKPGVNPKFIELAKRVALTFPYHDRQSESESVWHYDPLKQAHEITEAVWNFELPFEATTEVTVHLVKEAVALGLAVLYDSEAWGFLPNGKVLPVERHAQWDEIVDAVETFKRPSLGQIRTKMRELLEDRLQPHGFKLLPVREKGFFEFLRESELGSQELTIWVESYHGDHHAEASIRGDCAPVRAILLASQEPGYENLLQKNDFRASVLPKGAPKADLTNLRLYLETTGQINRFLDLLEEIGVGYLDQARTIEGLSKLCNDDPKQNPGTLLYGGGGFTSLICAHLTDHPCFEALEQVYRKDAAREDKDTTGRANGKTVHLDRLLRYLREKVKPLPKGEISADTKRRGHKT